MDSSVAAAAKRHIQGEQPIRRLNPAVVNEVFRLSEPGALDELEQEIKAPPPPPKAEPPAASPDQPAFVNSLSTSVRAVSAEELLDIQQQADFFVSLGQHDQAIEVLRHHIESTPDTSPLVYLDLLSILHQINLPDEYESLRSEVSQKFAVDVPAFDRFGEASEGLEKYGRALSRIQALWPGPRVLELLEESIFRTPGSQAASADEAFDLEAYRELLMLYALAKELSRDGGGDPRWAGGGTPSDADDHAMTATLVQPLSAALSTQFRGGAAAAEAGGGADIDLDLDFGAADAPAAPAPAPGSASGSGGGAAAEPAAADAGDASAGLGDMSLDFNMEPFSGPASPDASATPAAPKAGADDMSLDFDLPPIESQDDKPKKG